jgi:hypothetical protein
MYVKLYIYEFIYVKVDIRSNSLASLGVASQKH